MLQRWIWPALLLGLCLPATSSAFGLSYGVRAGAGFALLTDEAARGGDPDGDDSVSVTTLAAGLGVNLDLGCSTWRSTRSTGTTPTTTTTKAT